MTTSRAVRLARRPVGDTTDEDFSITTDEVPSPGPGQIVVRMMMVSVDPAMRGWFDDRPSYLPPIGIDEVIRRVEKEGEREVLTNVITMATHPFEDSWAGRTFDGVEYKGDAEEEHRWTSDVPEVRRAMQCSCSS